MTNPAPVKVKVCGITNAKDAQAAIRMGADALGFIFASSPRQIDERKARRIMDDIGPFVTMVGVFVNERPDRILRIASTCRLDAVQLHGDEDDRIAKQLAPYKIIKAFRFSKDLKLSRVNRYPADAVLFETPGAQRGGTGKTWPWEDLKSGRLKRPLIVTGGLTPLNVARAVQMLKPYAVDVSSGVESKPGLKNHDLMEQFICHAKKA